MLDTYDYHNPLNLINIEDSEPTEAEKLEQENWKLRLKIIDAYIILKECIDLAEGLPHGTLSKKLKSIKL